MDVCCKKKKKEKKTENLKEKKINGGWIKQIGEDKRKKKN